MSQEVLKAVVAVLKRRFNNLTAEELIDLAFQVVAEIEHTHHMVKR